MEFLDSLDAESLRSEGSYAYIQSRRLRSWYFYEQFKALERHQTDAAIKMKNRSVQGRLLHQEMAERRARRGIVDAYSVQSDSGIDRMSGDVKACVSADINNSFSDFEEFLNEQTHNTSAATDTIGTPATLDTVETDPQQSEEPHSRRSSECQIHHLETICISPRDVSADDRTDICNVSPNYDNLADEIKDDLEYAKKIIAENMEVQMQTAANSMQCLEENSADEDDKTNDASDFKYISVQNCDALENIGRKKNDVFCALSLWYKLVAFSYQIVQSYHGNCYSDYSCQFLTAVLACDIIRIGLYRMSLRITNKAC